MLTVGAQLQRALRDTDLRCDAARLAGDAGVVCQIEGSYIDGRESPTVIENFCGGCYTACPTWRVHKEAEWERRNLREELRG